MKAFVDGRLYTRKSTQPYLPSTRHRHLCLDISDPPDFPQPTSSPTTHVISLAGTEHRVRFTRSSCLIPSIPLFVLVQLLSHILFFVTPWIAAHQASLSFTVFQSLLKLMSTHSVSDAMQPSYPLLPHSPSALNLSQGSFPMS